MLYLALAEENLYDSLRLEKKGEWGNRKKMSADILLEQIQKQTFSMNMLYLNCLKKSLGVRCFFYVARLIVPMTTNQTRSNLEEKG